MPGGDVVDSDERHVHILLDGGSLRVHAFLDNDGLEAAAVVGEALTGLAAYR